MHQTRINYTEDKGQGPISSNFYPLLSSNMVLKILELDQPRSHLSSLGKKAFLSVTNSKSLKVRNQDKMFLCE